MTGRAGDGRIARPGEDLMARPASDAGQYQLARSAVVACACSVGWAALAGVAAVVARAITGSLALLAFGLDSVIDGSASGILVWRSGWSCAELTVPGLGQCPVVAASYCSTTLAGMRPRWLTRMPVSFAHARMSPLR
jgi:hypothetical protein